MLRKIRWKFTLIAVLIVLSILILLPLAFKNLPSWWGKVLPAEGLRLGLDLQGGMHLILKVDLDKAVSNQLDLVQRDLRETLRKKHISISKGKPADSTAWLHPAQCGTIAEPPEHPEGRIFWNCHPVHRPATGGSPGRIGL